MITRRRMEEWERQTLASCAVRSSGSRGRVHREEEHPYRTCFQRDHDRIIHSTAFRRLEYKTQVFLIHEGDYYRTRLTHSLEVAQIAETIARALRLNTDLVRSIALAHDLGHGPFGHSGEDALRDLMEGHGGFNHNLQALRIVDLLEQRYPLFPGLNLTWEVREGLNKHRVPLPGFSGSIGASLSLEAQVVNASDEIAYDHHDLDDGLTSGLIREEELDLLPIWRRIRRAADVQELRTNLVSSGGSMDRLRGPLKEFLSRRLYHHYKVVRMADKAQRLIVALFEAYLRKPEQLPDTTRSRLDREDPHRVICDYIAGMTDRYAIEEHRKLFDPGIRGL